VAAVAELRASQVRITLRESDARDTRIQIAGTVPKGLLGDPAITEAKTHGTRVG
jgi:hypothetical protein